MKFIFLFSITLLLLSSSLIAEEFVLNEKTRMYDQIHIKLEIKPDFEEASIVGKEGFTFVPLTDTVSIIALHAKTMTIKSVMNADIALQYSLENNLLWIQLGKQYSTKDTVTIEITYKALPERGMYFFKPTKEIPEIPYEIWTQGQGENNRYWFPAYDMTDDKRTAELFVTVPLGFQTVSNGELVDKKIEGKFETHHWKMMTPFVNYLTSLIIGHFTQVKEQVQGVDLEYNISSDWADRCHYFFGRTPMMLTFFSNYIYPYPFTRYAQTPVQDFEWGGMENICATTLNRRLLHDNHAQPNYYGDDLVAHEFAHQWWGDIVTCLTWKDIWLNEGFATYFTSLWEESYFEKEVSQMSIFLAYQSYLNTVHNTVKKYEDPNADPKQNREYLEGDDYEGGATILHMLRYELGDETFKKGIQKYIRDHLYGSVTTADFKNTMESVSGKDLAWFFDQWIYNSGYPELYVEQHYDSLKKELRLFIHQKVRGNSNRKSFQFKLPIEIRANNYSHKEDLIVKDTESVFTFIVPEAPVLIRINKGNILFCDLFFQLTLEQLTYQLLHDTDVTGRYIAAEKLKEFQETAIPILEKSFKSEKFYLVRQHILESLPGLLLKDIFPLLKDAVSDSDARVREKAYDVIAGYSSPELEKLLKQRLSLEQNDYTLAAIYASLVQGKYKKNESLIRKAMKMTSHRNVIQRRIFEAATLIKDPAYLDVAKEYIKYKYANGDMHLHDIAILDYAKEFVKDYHYDIISILSAGLKNPYFRTRIHAAEVMKVTKLKELLQVLRSVLKEERRESVKSVLVPILKSMEERQ